MARRAQPTLAALQAANARADRLEEACEAWRARFWQVYSGGMINPAEEDLVRFEALIGPMPPPFVRSM